MQAYLKKGSINARLRALDFLRTICHTDDQGYAVYDEGWSDKKVARHLRLGLATSVITNLRRDHIGKNRKMSLLNPPQVPQFRDMVQVTSEGIRPIHAIPDAVQIQLDSINTKLDAIIKSFGIAVNK